MGAFRKKRGLVNWDWYFSERMETSSVCEKDKKRQGRQNFVQKLCTHSKWANEQTVKCLSFLFLSFSHKLLVSILSPKYQSKLARAAISATYCKREEVSSHNDIC